MANPQLEDGHTRIANEILDNMARIYLPPNQWQVLVVVIRRTYGFQKKVDWIANCQIVEATGLVKSTVSRALHRLEERGLITRNGKSIGFQKDWEQWKVSSIANCEKLAIRKQKLADRKPELAILPTKVSSPRVTQKKKENIQKKIYKRNNDTQKNNINPDKQDSNVEDNVFCLYEREIGKLTPSLTEDLKELANEYPYSEIKKAVRVCAVNNKRSLGYLKGVLNNQGRKDAPAYLLGE